MEATATGAETEMLKNWLSVQGYDGKQDIFLNSCHSGTALKNTVIALFL